MARVNKIICDLCGGLMEDKIGGSVKHVVARFSESSDTLKGEYKTCDIHDLCMVCYGQIKGRIKDNAKSE